ncbi:MAG: hypothetical protein HY077_07140 [Elusimicrobia bacterium]|nr:hypothetical protein [Elusimicrobiota bacterium]
MRLLKTLGAAALSLLIAAGPILASDVVKPLDIRVSDVRLGTSLAKPLDLQTGLGLRPAEAVVPELTQVPAIPGETAVIPIPEIGASRRIEDPSQPSAEFADALQQRLAEPFGPSALPQPLADAPFEAPDSIKQTSIALDPNRKYYPSPADWRDELVYSVVLDRFCRAGDCQTVGDPKDGVTRHGGNIKGLISKLDYIKESEATAILLSPLLLNPPDSYHGYAPIHFMAVDPNLGTMEDVKTLVAEAHKRGIRVIMDWVTNHAGPVFEYKEGSKYRGDGPPKEIGEWTAQLKPVELAQAEHFTRRGVIDNWNDHGQSVSGDFPPNYRHFAADNPATQELLIHILKWWMKETDVDGIRLDAVKHFAPGFYRKLVDETRAYAARMGKADFLIIPENSSGVDSEITPFVGIDGTYSAYNYPAYRRENYALHGKAPTRAIEESLQKNLEAWGPASGSFMRFIDNNDVYRFLRDGEPLSILKLAFSHLLFSTGIPLVYYGTEQAFRQAIDRLDPEGPFLPADPRNREDMWGSGQFKSKSSAGDKFDTASESFRFFKRLGKLRKDLAPLRRGLQYFRYTETGGPGISAFSRIYNGQEVLVVMNTANEARLAEMWVDSGLTPVGTTLADELDPGYTVTAHAPIEGGSRVSVQVRAHGVRVFTRR